MNKIINAIKTYLLNKPSTSDLTKEIIFRLLSTIPFAITYILLLCLTPIKKVRIGFLEALPLGHLALNTDLLLRRRQIGIIPKKSFYIIFIYNAVNKQLLKMFKRNIFICENRFIGRLLSFFCIFDTRFCQHTLMNSNEYKEYQASSSSLTFTKEEENYGKLQLEKMGIEKESWFVCIFARDSTHYNKVYGYNNNSTMNFRDANIDSYIESVKYIISHGGYVLRMGMNVSQEFTYKDPKMIDYAMKYRSDFMDVFLTAKCKFFIGTASGGADMARIFDKHHLAVNWTPIGWAPWGKNEIYMPKTLCYAETLEQVPYAKALELAKSWTVSLDYDIEEKMREHNVVLVPNTPEQILDATKEIMGRIDGTHIESEAYHSKLEKYFELRKVHSNWCSEVYTPVAENYLMSLKL